MEKKYYLNINKQNTGPFDLEEISSKILNGELNDNSYIYVKGDKAWTFIKNLEEFKEAINKQNPKIQKKWFIHKNKTNIGPLCVNEILEKIEANEFDITDYTWKEGMPNWVQINTLEEFLQVKEDMAHAGPQLENLIENINNNNQNNVNNDELKIEAKEEKHETKVNDEITADIVINNNEQELKDNIEIQEYKEEVYTEEQNIQKEQVTKEEKTEKETTSTIKKIHRIPELLFAIILFIIGFTSSSSIILNTFTVIGIIFMVLFALANKKRKNNL